MLMCSIINAFNVITDVSLQSDNQKQKIREKNPGLYIPDLKYNMRNSTKVCFFSLSILILGSRESSATFGGIYAII
jgi:hypothetical protein